MCQRTGVRNYVGDASVNITTANDGGATYVPPPCSAPHSAASVPEPGALALWILGLVALGVHRAYRRAIRTEYAAPPSAPCTVRTSQ